MTAATEPNRDVAEPQESEAKELREELERYLAQVTKVSVSLGEFQQLTGGNAREMWAFDAQIDGKTEALLLRKDPPGGGPHAIRFQLERAQEYRIMESAAAAGVPVARVRWLIDDVTVLGEAGFIMERLAGETIPRRILREPRFAHARTQIAFQLGQILARLRSIDCSTLGLPKPPGGHPVLVQLEEYGEYLDELDDPRPAFALAMRWLRENIPPSSGLGTVHGDFRNGNLMVDEKGIQAVLDWETVHVGDPMEDLGWLCVRSWRYGNVSQRAGGFGSLNQLLDGYESVAGVRPDPAVVSYWQIFGTLKWGILSSSKPAKRERQGVSSGVMAAPGRRLEGLAQSRRAAEMEYDVLQLIRGR